MPPSRRGPADGGDRRPPGGRQHRSPRAPRPEDEERARRAAAPGRPPRPGRGDGPGRPPREGGRPAPAERPAHGERPARGERPQPGERPARGGERPARSERPRPARSFRPGRSGGQSRDERKRDEYLERKRQVEKDKGAIWVPGPHARTIRAEAGLDLAHFVVNQSKGHLSVRAARTLLEDGCCRINGRIETFGSRRLLAGEVVELILPPEPTEHVFDAKRLLWSDPCLFAYDKPAFLPVTPTDAAKSWSLTDILRAAVEGDVIPVHRIDADTSGVVLFARRERTARLMEELFAAHQVRKTYRAIVRGHPPEKGRRVTYLVKVGSGKGFERWKSGRGADAREAITAWEVETRLGRYASLVRIEPETGRHHQIRLHFSEIGHPLYGDRIYGDRLDPVHVHRQLLHASSVQFTHPDDGTPVKIESHLPLDMRQAMGRLKDL